MSLPKRAKLRHQYSLSIEVGFVLSLVLLLAAFRADWRPAPPPDWQPPTQEPIALDEIRNTKHEVPKPPPPRPALLAVVPDETLLEAGELNLDQGIDVDDVLRPAGPPPSVPDPDRDEPDFIYVAEEMPELVGGLASIQSKIRYPEIAKKAGVEGRVYIQFIVDEQGNVVDPQVVRGIGAGCDEEAVRAIRTAKFKPGKQRGKPVRVKMSLPITFKLK